MLEQNLYNTQYTKALALAYCLPCKPTQRVLDAIGEYRESHNEVAEILYSLDWSQTEIIAYMQGWLNLKVGSRMMYDMRHNTSEEDNTFIVFFRWTTMAGLKSPQEIKNKFYEICADIF